MPLVGLRGSTPHQVALQTGLPEFVEASVGG